MALHGINRFTGGTERPAGHDEVYTAPWLFEQLGVSFDLDVCAPEGGLPWIPAARSLSIADDGLAQPWTGTVWMNPPYSAARQWVTKWLNHADGLALVPFSKSHWFENLWNSSAALAWVPGQASHSPFTKNGSVHRVFTPVVLAGIGPHAHAVERVGTARTLRGNQ